MKKELENPVLIPLDEITEDGRSLEYSRDSGELNDTLKDVIGKHNFQVNLHIAPLGNAYSVTGSIKTKMDLVCCKCAMDIAYGVSEKVEEIFVVSPSMPRSGKSARVNHSTELHDSGPECTELESPLLHVGEFVREIIVMTEPNRPMGSSSCETSETCPNLVEAKKGGWAIENFSPVNSELSPFAALKDFKLNN